MSASARIRAAMPSIGRYGLVGGLATAIDYSGFLIAMSLSAGMIAANLIGWLSSLMVAYFLHTYFTFKTTPSLSRFIGFIGVSLSTLAISTVVLLSAALFIKPYAAKAVAIIVTFFSGFVLSRMNFSSRRLPSD